MIFDGTYLRVISGSVPLVVAIMRETWLFASQKSTALVAVPFHVFYGHAVTGDVGIRRRTGAD